MFDPFLALLAAHGFPPPETEVRFAPPRRWRADYCWRREHVIVECEGGLFSRTRRAHQAHAEPVAILRDMAKSNAAQLEGYVYLRFTPTQLTTQEALSAIRRALDRSPTRTVHSGR